ncbi:hypothetical protein AXF42_Ash016172 [Apostasia shenzhenica]|uniref:Vitamin K epoxide reductase domain-containing protein n=1 Tax=Apostasia shenzhenica TaxID=1088818 RepID=A0A2I0AEN2_9ASPA|nr:hypothetical protein AXF42_Ash016172 [Apostasia shenzhenica]
MASISSACAIPRLQPLPAVRFPAASSLRLKPAASLLCRCGPTPKVDSDSVPQEKAFLLGISTSSWCAGLGGLGFLETAYLTYLKLSNSEAFCPTGGASCSDVLNSEYSYIYGVPLPLIGLVSYGLVTVLALKQSGKDFLSGLRETDRVLLMGLTTSMATSSAYFLYLLSTKLEGASCSYCLFSAFLSFSIFFINLKEYALKELQTMVGLQLAVSALVFAALSNSYMTASPNFSASSDITLEPVEREITEKSTPWTIALAKHLHAIGAKMYGAFWCSHCMEQKQMFGREAAQILDYVECFPDGGGKGRKMALECTLAKVEGFPTWIIKDKVLSGEQDLQALADASEFVFEDGFASTKAKLMCEWHGRR